jgi:hypothetical protein
MKGAKIAAEIIKTTKHKPITASRLLCNFFNARFAD